MKKIKVGVVGVYRGGSMMKYCNIADNAELVAICDKWVEGLERKKKELGTDTITYYTDFEEFIKHDMDAVVLANYANEHAPFAIKCLKAGKHVFSEVLPVQTLQGEHCIGEDGFMEFHVTEGATAQWVMGTFYEQDH